MWAIIGNVLYIVGLIGTIFLTRWLLKMSKAQDDVQAAKGFFRRTFNNTLGHVRRWNRFVTLWHALTGLTETKLRRMRGRFEAGGYLDDYKGDYGTAEI